MIPTTVYLKAVITNLEEWLEIVTKLLNIQELLMGSKQQVLLVELVVITVNRDSSKSIFVLLSDLQRVWSRKP